MVVWPWRCTLLPPSLARGPGQYAAPRWPHEACAAIPPITGTNGYSFPSGHTLNSTATYGLLAVMAWRSRQWVGTHGTAVAIGVTLPILVGVSRIALGAHWSTDVLAGTAFVALGAVLLRLTWAVDRGDVGR